MQSGDRTDELRLGGFQPIQKVLGSAWRDVFGLIAPSSRSTQIQRQFDVAAWCERVVKVGKDRNATVFERIKHLD